MHRCIWSIYTFAVVYFCPIVIPTISHSFEFFSLAAANRTNPTDWRFSRFIILTISAYFEAGSHPKHTASPSLFSHPQFFPSYFFLEVVGPMLLNFSCKKLKSPERDSWSASSPLSNLVLDVLWNAIPGENHYPNRWLRSRSFFESHKASDWNFIFPVTLTVVGPRFFLVLIRRLDVKIVNNANVANENPLNFCLPGEIRFLFCTRIDSCTY